MGAGKTTVGARLAGQLGWRFVDSDRVVEARAGTTIAEIFALRGEAVFREMETAAVEQAARGQHVVVALGGGAVETPATRELLAALEECVVIFLEAPLEILIARCSGHATGPVRPVLADRARLAERWKARLPWYRQAHLTVDTLERAPEVVAESILQEIRGSVETGTPADLPCKPGAQA
jgi:shikimate kinase